MRLLVTGVTGFIGSAVVSRSVAQPWQVRGTARRRPATLPAGAEWLVVGELAQGTDWSRAVHGVDVVVHTAARVQVMRDKIDDPLAAFRRANVEGTVELARQAVAAGVERFIYLSSIKVNGEQTVHGQRFNSADAPAPVDPYALSKAEAEEALRTISKTTRMSVTIIRPVLVYGPGVKGTFLSMLRLLDRGIPLPFGALENARSFVGLDNLVDLILTCAHHPAARNQTFLVSDGEDLSTPALLRRMAAALGKRAYLIPIPERLIEMACRALGKRDIAQRIAASLQVDISATQTQLGWSPPFSIDDGLRKTAEHFLEQESDHSATAGA